MNKSLLVESRSISPLLMHKYNGIQPSKAKQKKGEKTQAHIDEEAKRDWLASAYWQNDTFCVPPEVLEAALADSAKSFRFGKTFKKAIAVADDFIPLRIFNGPDDKKGYQAKGKLEDWYKPGFVDIRGVRIGPSRIDRCRPIFYFWGLSFTIVYDDEQVEREQVIAALNGMIIGDNRPRYGRSKVVALVDAEQAAA